MNREFKHWETEKKRIPGMIRMYCRGNHGERRKEEGVGRGEMCSNCRALAEYALFRLEKCPFKKNKEFCSYCKIHCYRPEYRAEMKEVMRYSGPRMIVSHPIFALSHVAAMIKHKRALKGKASEELKKNDR